ncbi:MAG: bifunctional folylpolyglutamate synthase/dihydrofolate synthase [Cytophagales bacterium]|nr:bifunctional folylpolyglutamate synthase/dihydrofolate synthase [Cytophagales bacterium]
MQYSEALDNLYSRLPMYQRQGKAAYKGDLKNTILLLDAVGNPQEKFKSIHIAGTNGKGTSAHAIAAILQLSGYKVGLYTSPHLKNFTERIKINGAEISQKGVVDFVSKVKSKFEKIKPSFFEVTVAMAFQYFADEQVDIAIVETGLGGRLDSTNVLQPEVCLITNIGLDHTDLLGDTIEKIAKEKAGIIKMNVPVVIGDMVENAVEIMEKAANRVGSKLIKTVQNDEYQYAEIPYFNRNVPGVMGVINELRKQGWNIPKRTEQQGLANFAILTNLKGRYQVWGESPKVIADVSHNPDGLSILLNYVNDQAFNELHLIFGTVIDKNMSLIFKVLPENANYYFTQSAVPRSLDVNSLKDQAEKHGILGEAYKDVNLAKKAALSEATPDDLVLITGSTFVVAEIEEL